MFECTTLHKIEVIEYGRMGFKWLECFLRYKDFNEKGVQSPLSYSSHVAAFAVGSSLSLSVLPSLRKHSLWVQPFLYIYFVVFGIWQCVVHDSNFDLHIQLQYSKGNKEDITMTYTTSGRGSVLRLTYSNLSMYIEVLNFLH